MSRRDQLIEQMSTSIREKGLGSSTMESVLSKSGVTAGSMYHYFPAGKEALAAASVQAAGQIGAEQLRSTLETTGSTAAGTVKFYEQLAEEMEADRFRYGCPVGVPSTEAATNETIREAGAQALKLWVEVIADALQEEGMNPEDAKAVARFAIAAYEGASTLARATHDTSVIYDTMNIVSELLESRVG